MSRHQFCMLLLQLTGGCLLALFLAAPTYADVLIHQNLQALADQAETIFSGTCVSVSEGTEYFQSIGLIGYTEYAFSVEEWIKGKESGSPIKVIRQARPIAQQLLGAFMPLQVRANSDSLTQNPTYASGQKYVLFLHPANEWGLTCPVGSSQGVFTVTQETRGEPSLVNGCGNLGLFRGMQQLETAAQLIPAEGEQALSARSRTMLRYGAFLTLTRNLTKLNANR